MWILHQCKNIGNWRKGRRASGSLLADFGERGGGGRGGGGGQYRVAGVGVEGPGRAGAAGARKMVVDGLEAHREVVADPGVSERVGR